jgi:type I restriction enzyme S subunit
MKLTEKQNLEGWRVVKFGDVAQEMKASTKDPIGEGIERYIGLEHIDPESLRLVRYGLIAEDNPTFTKKFSAGDILFGRRRAYLKKAAVAEFDGICSGDIIVIAPKGDTLIPDLLPFIVQSEPFFDWAVKHSAGGLSPRTKFKSLAEFEFPLPPRVRQEEMLEVLNNFKKCIILNESAKEMLKRLKRVLTLKLFPKSGKSTPDLRFPGFIDHWIERRLGDVVTFVNGKAHENKISEDGRYIVVNSKYISTDGQIAKRTDFQICPIYANDLVMVMSDIPNGKALAKCLFIKENDTYTLNQRICALREKRSSNQFLCYQINRNKYFLDFDNGLGQTNMRKSEVLNCPVNIPSLPEQKKIADFLMDIDAQIQKREKNELEIKKIKSKWMNEILKVK